MPHFVQTLDGYFLATAHVVTLAHMPDGNYRATTADHRTFNLSPEITKELLHNAERNPPKPNVPPA